MADRIETITINIRTDNYHAFALLVDAIASGDLAVATDRHGDVHRTSVEVQRGAGAIRQTAKFEAEDGGKLVEIED